METYNVAMQTLIIVLALWAHQSTMTNRLTDSMARGVAGIRHEMRNNMQSYNRAITKYRLDGERT